MKTLEDYMVKATSMAALALAKDNNDAFVKVRRAAINCLSKVVGSMKATEFFNKVILPMAYDMRDDVLVAYEQAKK